MEDDTVTRRAAPRLLPKDEAASNPRLLAFRRELLAAVARRDTDAILRVADPDVQLDFDSSRGIESLRQQINSDQGDVWQECGRALTLGGRFQDGAFIAPYVSSAWSDTCEPWCSAIIGRAVLLRERPHTNARILARLDYDVVEPVIEGPRVTGWERVRLANGTVGFVSARFVRSPNDYRAWFVSADGRWRLKAFMAGD